MKYFFSPRFGKHYQSYHKIEDNDFEITAPPEKFYTPFWDNTAKKWEETASYIEKRQKDYPTIEEQFDILYHKGIKGWSREIQEIKERHPKSLKK